MAAGKITESRLNESIERILRAKYKIGLNTTPQYNATGLSGYLKRNQTIAIKQKLTEAAITVIADHENLIPIKKIDGVHVGTLSVNVIHKSRFQKRVDNYLDARHYQFLSNQLVPQYQQLMNTMSQFDVAIIRIHTSGRQNDFSREIPEDLIKFIKELEDKIEECKDWKWDKYE